MSEIIQKVKQEAKSTLLFIKFANHLLEEDDISSFKNNALFREVCEFFENKIGETIRKAVSLYKQIDDENNEQMDDKNARELKNILRLIIKELIFLCKKFDEDEDEDGEIKR